MPETLHCYEHPLNEHMRSALRLEFLFREFRRLETAADQRRCVIPLICDLLSLLSRADAWSEIGQDLQKEIEQLQMLRSAPVVDTAKLQQTLLELEDARKAVSRVKLAEIRIPKLLLAVMQRASVPGGLAPADTPAYAYWLNRRPELQRRDIQSWTQPLVAYETALTLYLKLVRSRAEWTTVELDHGQHCLQGKPRHSLLRIGIPETDHWYPEVSGGRQRMNIRLRGTQTTDDEAARQVNQLKIALC